MQKHSAPRQSVAAAGQPPAAATGSDDSSPARPRHKRKGKSKKDKSKKDKKHKKRHAEKVITCAREFSVVRFSASCAFGSFACLHENK